MEKISKKMTQIPASRCLRTKSKPVRDQVIQPPSQTLEDSSAAIVTHINRCAQVLPPFLKDEDLRV